MARINFDDAVLKDPRFFNLVVKLGGSTMAIGSLVEAWMLAQTYWVPNKKPIPSKIYHSLSTAQALLDVGLAESISDGVYIKGSEEAFEWLFKKREAGKKGGLKSQEKISSSAQAEPSTFEQNRPSSSFSSSISVSREEEGTRNISKSQNKKTTRKRGAASPDSQGESPRVNELIAHFCDRWQDTYPNAEPYHVQPKDAGILSNLRQSMSFEKLWAVIDAYLDMRDQDLIKAAHPISFIPTKLPAINRFQGTGKTITQSELNQADVSQSNFNALQAWKAKRRLKDEQQG